MKVKVSVPATTANLGPGFDCLGLALGLYNAVEMETADGRLRITIDGEGLQLIPIDASNLVYRAVHALFEHVGEPLPALHIHLSNAIPLMSGLGSSSAAIVGGLVAANALLGEPLAADELLRLAIEIEGHPDNVAPALLGGLVVVVDVGGTPVYRRIETPPLAVVVGVPDFRLATVEARAALPKQVPLADAVFNLGRTALVVQSLAQADYDLLASVMDDRLHQPYRAPLVPGLADVFRAARQAGAAGVALSGAGPSVVAFAPGQHDAIADAMCLAFADHGLDARAMVLETTTEGARVINAGFD
jgi:homoserine kinase